MSSYNQAKFMKQAIESVLSQETSFPFQLIITDDNSTLDNSVEIIKEYHNKYSNIVKIILSEDNGGYLVNVLRAKSLTKTNYFCLLDADDYWTDTSKLQKAYDFLELNPDYVIYSTNTLCVYENGEKKPFILTDIKESTFSLDDYFKENIIISQTTGTVFRNVIFKNGIPEIIKKSVNSLAKRSFEGDFDRFLLHLKYGKSKFINHIDGVYRILSGGIWSKLSLIEKYVIEARARIDYNEYFEDKYSYFFHEKAFSFIKMSFDLITESIVKNIPINISHNSAVNFFYILSKCIKHKKIKSNDSLCKMNVYNKTLLWIYNLLKQKLNKNGII
jgi:hypothetical protein